MLIDYLEKRFGPFPWTPAAPEEVPVDCRGQFQVFVYKSGGTKRTYYTPEKTFIGRYFPAYDPASKPFQGK